MLKFLARPNQLQNAVEIRKISKLRQVVPNSVSVKVGRGLLQVQKGSPTLLFGAGVVGVVATAVLASRATLKLEATLEESKDNLRHAKRFRDGEFDYDSHDYQRDVTLIYLKGAGRVAKLYAPALAVGTLSVSALTGSHVILTRRNVALTAAYAAIEKSFSEYRQRVVAELGEERDREFRYGSERQKTVSNSPEGPKQVDTIKVPKNGPSGYARFFDQLSPSWNREPEYNMLFLKCQQNWANDMLRSRGHIFLNEVYDMLGIPRSSSGSVVGWVIGEDGDNYVDFGIFDATNPMARRFVNGDEGAILLDFNVDGVIYDKIGKRRR